MSTQGTWPNKWLPLTKSLETFEKAKGEWHKTKSNYQIEQDKKLAEWQKNHPEVVKEKNVNKDGQYFI